MPCPITRELLAQHSLRFPPVKQQMVPTSARANEGPLPLEVPARTGATAGRRRILFVVGDDADSLWLHFSYVLASILGHEYKLECCWVRLTNERGSLQGSHVDGMQICKSSARDLARLFRRPPVQIVHALGAQAIRHCQRARWLVYPPPLLLCFPGEEPARTPTWQWLLDRATRATADRYVTRDYDSRASLLATGIEPHRATVIPLATRRRTSPTRAVARAAVEANPLRFVMTASFELADPSDSQWLALEILAEMIHRGVPSLLIAAARSPVVAERVWQRAHDLDVAANVRCTELLPDTHACVVAADVVLLTGPQPAAPWLALAALDAGVPVVKSPKVRLPPAVAELPAARELLHPLPREDLHTWLDTMEDFRPRASRASLPRPEPAPVLPTLDDVAKEYFELYRQLYRYRPRRR